MGGCCRSPAPGGGRGRAGLGSFAPGFLLRAEYSPGHGSVIESVARFGPIAQLGERRVRNAEVVSSILILSTNSKTQPLPVGFFLARRASTGGAFGGVWCFTIILAVRYSAHQASDASLFSI